MNVLCPDDSPKVKSVKVGEVIGVDEEIEENCKKVPEVYSNQGFSASCVMRKSVEIQEKFFLWRFNHHGKRGTGAEDRSHAERNFWEDVRLQINI